MRDFDLEIPRIPTVFLHYLTVHVEADHSVIDLFNIDFVPAVGTGRRLAPASCANAPPLFVQLRAARALVSTPNLPTKIIPTKIR